MCAFLGTAAPLPNGVGNITVKLLSGDVEVNCSIPVTNCLVLVHSINSPEQLFVQLINFTDDRTIVFSVDFIGNVTVAVGDQPQWCSNGWSEFLPHLFPEWRGLSTTHPLLPVDEGGRVTHDQHSNPQL